MSIEEKAKAYDEALDRMKHVVIVPKNEKALQALKETIFPELAESEDERIRKWLYDLIADNLETTICPFPRKDVLAYLESRKKGHTGE